MRRHVKVEMESVVPLTMRLYAVALGAGIAVGSVQRAQSTAAATALLTCGAKEGRNGRRDRCGWCGER